MTKEELQKEAVKRVDAFIDSFSQDIRSTLYDRLNQEDVKDFLYSLYIDSAEPREKRIEELEQQIEKMKCCEICEYGGNVCRICYSPELCNNRDKWKLSHRFPERKEYRK